jgi:hypothetical protein
MSEELVNSCYELEKFVESLDDRFEIVNSWSDFQPSYSISKREGDRMYVLEVKPRIREGKLLFFVVNDSNVYQNILNSLPEGGRSFSFNCPGLASLTSPYIWDFERLKNEIVNIDISKGFVFEPPRVEEQVVND